VKDVTCNQGIDRAYSGWYFEEVLQTVIHSMKYNERAKLGYVLGRLLGRELSYRECGPLDLLLPIPLHPVKKRDRGYNQAAWIVKGLAAEWRIAYRMNLVRRVKYTVSQTTLNVVERRRNMERAFRLSSDVTGLRVGVVDDVLTTGSTISACAQALKAAGVREVVALTVSTPKPEHTPSN
jgi:ComF family protein